MSGDALKAFSAIRPHLGQLHAALDLSLDRSVNTEAVAEVGRQLAYRYDPQRRGYVDDRIDQLAEAIGITERKVKRSLHVLNLLGIWTAEKHGGSRDAYGSRRIPGPALCATAHRLGLNLSTPQTALELGPVSVPDTQELGPVSVPDTQELGPVSVPDTHGTRTGLGRTRTGLGRTRTGIGPLPIDTEKENPPTPLAAQTEARTAETGRMEEIVNEYVRITLEQLHKKPTNPRAYAKVVIDTALAHPDLHRWMREYPHVPANQIAAWMHGDKHSMQYVKAASG
jgi:hypothetical protein